MIDIGKTIQQLENYERVILSLARDVEILKTSILEVNKTKSDNKKEYLNLICSDLSTMVHGLQCAHSAVEWAAQRLGLDKLPTNDEQQISLITTPPVNMRIDGDKICAELTDDMS
jgi:hypothetical protein